MPLLLTLRHSGVTRKEGFDLEIDIAGWKEGDKPVRKMSDRAKCLLAGEYQFLSGLHHETYVHRARGDKRLVYLAQTQNAWDDRLVMRPEIAEPRQLEGKKVLTGNAPCVYGNLREGLKLAGAEPSKIEFIFAPTEGAKYPSDVILQKLAAGEAQAANVDIPFDLRARKKGFNALKLPHIPVIHNTTICASTEFVRKNEDATLAFLRALVRAIHFFKTEKKKVCAILRDQLSPLVGLESEEEIDYLHREWSQLLCSKPYPDPQAIWNVYNLDVAQDPKVNFIAPLEVWDTHYLRQIDDTGFIENLYGTATQVATH